MSEAISEQLIEKQSEKTAESIAECEENSENIKTEKAESSSDPYAYLERGDFSSEKFKIEIKNLPKFYGVHVSVASILQSCFKVVFWSRNSENYLTKN